MISDEERRDVVYNLRDEADHWRNYRKDDDTLCMLDSSFTESILTDFGFDDIVVPAYEVFNKLADLIDSPTCEDVGDGWTFRCSECGCSLDTNDREGEPTMWLEGRPMTPRRCPNCGAMVVDDD